MPDGELGLGRAMKPVCETIREYLALLTGDPEASVHWRILPESPFEKARVHALEKAERARLKAVGDPAWKKFALRRNHEGTLAEMRQTIEEKQAAGWAVFIVVNAGGHRGKAITRVRSLFVDKDDGPVPAEWHVTPSFIARRSATRWHAYWVVVDCPLDSFKDTQKRLAIHYSSDPDVHDLPRLLRVRGTWHLKSEPVLVELQKLAGTFYGIAEVMAGLQEFPPPGPKPASGPSELRSEVRRRGFRARPEFAVSYRCCR
jgi:hypothetical protein